MEHDEIDMRDVARELRRVRGPGREFDDAVMRAVGRLPRHARRGGGLWTRLRTPRTITVTPLSLGLLAASLMVVATLGVVRGYGALHGAGKPLASALFPATRVVPHAQRVQFVLVAPDAKKVAVVGDFNGWDVNRAAYQAQHRGGGVWSVTAPVPPGHHRYSFVVDDSVWVPDPTAPRVVDSDFGVPNSAIVVEDVR